MGQMIEIDIMVPHYQLTPPRRSEFPHRTPLVFQYIVVLIQVSPHFRKREVRGVQETAGSHQPEGNIDFPDCGVYRRFYVFSQENGSSASSSCGKPSVFETLSKDKRPLAICVRNLPSRSSGKTVFPQIWRWQKTFKLRVFFAHALRRRMFN